MKPARKSSEQPRTATGRLLGVLGIFWLNLVIAPCALAFGAEHDCPHCPTAQKGEMPAHHGHHEGSASKGCDALAADCDDLGSLAHDGRGAQPKLKHKSEPVPAPPPATPDLPVTITDFMTTTTGPPDPVATFRPRHLLNCVFLD